VKKKALQEQVSGYCEEVMQLGNEHHYRPLQVNGALVIGGGPEGWHAYAVLATRERIGEIERAMKRGEQG
jgi:hypothetical protein